MDECSKVLFPIGAGGNEVVVSIVVRAGIKLERTDITFVIYFLTAEG